MVYPDQRISTGVIGQLAASSGEGSERGEAWEAPFTRSRPL